MFLLTNVPLQFRRKFHSINVPSTKVLSTKVSYPLSKTPTHTTKHLISGSANRCTKGCIDSVSRGLYKTVPVILSLIFLFIFYLLYFPSISSRASLPFLSRCQRTASYTEKQRGRQFWNAVERELIETRVLNPTVSEAS